MELVYRSGVLVFDTLHQINETQKRMEQRKKTDMVFWKAKKERHYHGMFLWTGILSISD
jgi:hypothetical protein